jgi:hypothetical protein
MVTVAGWMWCHRCGHRVAGREELAGGPAAGSQHRRPRRQESEFALAARLIPGWVWVLLAGLTAVTATSCAADISLALPSFARAVWSTTQFFVGIVCLLMAGVCVSHKLGLNRDHYILVDLLLPDRLWVKAVKALPETRWPVCVAAWSLTAAICAAVWVGGWTYWLPEHMERRPGKSAVAKYVKEAAGKKELNREPGDGNPEDPLAPQDGTPQDPAAPDRPEAAAPPRSVTRCIVVGYTMKDGEVASLLMATVDGGEMRYAGTVPVGDDPDVKKDLLTRFTPLKADAPVFPDLGVRAVWLQPRLACEVESAGLDEDQLLKEAQFKGLVFPKKPQPVRVPAPAAAGPGAAVTPKDPRPKAGTQEPNSKAGTQDSAKRTRPVR